MKDFWIYTVYKAEFKTNQSVTYSKWQSLVKSAHNQIQNKEALPSWVSGYHLGNYLYHNLLSISAEEVHRTAAFLHLKFECYKRGCTAKRQEGTKFHGIFSVALSLFASRTKAEEHVKWRNMKISSLQGCTIPWDIHKLIINQCSLHSWWRGGSFLAQMA